MGVITKNNKLVVKVEPKTIYFDLCKVDNSLKHEVGFIIKYHEILAEHTIRTMLVNYCPNITMEMIFMNTEKKKVNESNTYGFNLLLRLDLKSSNKNIVHQNLSIYYT